MRTRTIGVTGVILIALAMVSWTFETIYYGGRLDANSVVQESFFLPLGFLLTAAGILALLTAGAMRLLKRWRSTYPDTR